MDVGLAPILFVLMVSMTAVRSQIRRGPANALKEVGNCVTLKCVTVSRNCDRVEWQKVEGMQSPKLVYRNGIGMLNNDIYPTQRYSVNSTGGCGLTITQLEINDSGRFMCVLAVDSGEETRTSILVVINVTESCLSNVTSNALDKGDGYSLWCAINIPAKSVEPSNVVLALPAEAAGERNTTDVTQPQTVKMTLTGTAKEENITRVCRMSFPPNTQANYDNTTPTLDVCTKQWIVSHPVESTTVSTSGLYYKSDTVGSTADGHPPPTFKGTHLKSGDGEPKSDASVDYTSTGTNTVKGRETHPVESTTVSTSGLYYKSDTVGSTADGHPPPTFKGTHSKSGDGEPKSDASVDYTSTATNTVKGRETHPVESTIVSTSGLPKIDAVVAPIDAGRKSALGPGGIAGIAIATMAVGTAIGVASSAAWRHFKKKNDKNGKKLPNENPENPQDG